MNAFFNPFPQTAYFHHFTVQSIPNESKSHPTFFLVEYPVSLKNTSDYISKITCEEHDFNFIALYSHSMPTIVSFIKGFP